jgi:hypothetical protein
VFVNSPAMILLFSSFILVCSKDSIFMIISLLNLLRLVFWHKMWLILVEVPWPFEKHVYFAVKKCSVHLI